MLSQGGSAGSNPVGATEEVPGQGLGTPCMRRTLPSYGSWPEDQESAAHLFDNTYLTSIFMLARRGDNGNSLKISAVSCRAMPGGNATSEQAWGKHDPAYQP
jgi:hypothetical protein